MGVYTCVWKGRLEQTQRLGFSLPHVDNVMLWCKTRHCLSKISSYYQLTMTTYGVIDPNRMPLWMLSGGVLRVTSGSRDTERFFTRLLRSKERGNNQPKISNRALLVEVNAEPRSTRRKNENREKSEKLTIRIPQYVMFYVERKKLYAVPVTVDESVMSVLYSHSTTIKQEEEEMEQGDGDELADKSVWFLDTNEVKKEERGKEGTKVAADPKEEGQTSFRATPFELALRQSTGFDHDIYKPVQETEYELRNRTAIQRLAFSALRLRGINKENNVDFALLCQLAVKGTCLALKGQLRTPHLNISQAQETVDKLLAIFLNDDDKSYNDYIENKIT